jgi:hypothetical protein
MFEMSPSMISGGHGFIKLEKFDKGGRHLCLFEEGFFSRHFQKKLYIHICPQNNLVIVVGCKK